MSAKKGFSKKELADQNLKVADLAKEEGKLIAAIERGERKLAEDREKLKETQRSLAAENANLEQMIQKGIRAAAKGATDQRAALIAALLMGDAGDPEPEPQLQLDTTRKATGAKAAEPAPATEPAPAAETPPATTGGEPEQSPAPSAPEGDSAQSEAA